MMITILEEDIETANAEPCRNPLTAALQRVTGTPWKMTNLPFALETVKPHRIVVLTPEAMSRLESYKQGDTFTPFEFDADLLQPR